MLSELRDPDPEMAHPDLISGWLASSWKNDRKPQSQSQEVCCTAGRGEGARGEDMPTLPSPSYVTAWEGQGALVKHLPPPSHGPFGAIVFMAWVQSSQGRGSGVDAIPWGVWSCLPWSSLIIVPMWQTETGWKGERVACLRPLGEFGEITWMC